MGRRNRVVKIEVNSFGNLLSMQKGQIIIKNKEGIVKKYPLSTEIDEIQVASGNLISTGLLTYLGCWDIPLLVQTRVGRPIAVLKDIEDDSHISTRLAQYEATKNGKGEEVAKRLVIGKIQGENLILEKYGLKPYPTPIEQIESLEDNDPIKFRSKLTGIEGKAGENYFEQISQKDVDWILLYNPNALPSGFVPLEKAKELMASKVAATSGSASVYQPETKFMGTLPQNLKSFGEKIYQAKDNELRELVGYELDHIKPLSEGGDNSPENLRWIKREKNLHKQDK